MNKFTHTAIFHYTAEQMFTLVNDVAAYPQFLPWCAASKILQQDQHSMRASITNKNGISFTTQNTLIPYSHITTTLVEGPFSAMNSEWRFVALDNEGCEITFMMQYAFKNKLLNLALSPFFSSMGMQMISAFADRAAFIYGAKNAS